MISPNPHRLAGKQPPSAPPSGGARAGRAGGRRAAALAVLLALGVAVFANLIATRVSSRFDLTEDHVFTLSPASRALVRGLPDPLTVKAYISGDLPPALEAVARYARELLEEYRLSSEGKLVVEILDPEAGDPRVEEQVGRCRIAKTTVEVRNTSKREVSQHTLGLCLWYDGRSRALAPIDATAGLEYQISALIKAMSQTRRKVAFTAGHGERDLGQDYSFARHALEQELDVITMDPSTAALGDDVDLVVVAGPRRPFDDRARRAIDAFLMKGRPALFLIDGMELDAGVVGETGLRQGRPVDSGLDPLLGAYGFRVARDFVFDRLNVPGPVDLVLPVSARRGPLFVNLPAFVAIRLDPALGKQLSVTAGIDAVVFPFASSLELVGPLAPGAPPAAGRLWTLARTSIGAWRQVGPFSMSAEAALATATAEATAAAQRRAGGGQAFALAYAYQGTLASAYPVAEPIGRPTGGISRSARPVRLVVVADSAFVSDRYMELLRSFPIYAGGAQLLLNAVSWTLEDDALTALRANVRKARPLRLDGDGGGQRAGDGLGDDRTALIKWGNIAGLPLGVCVAGLLRMRWRLTMRRRQTLTDRRAPRPPRQT